MRFGRRCPTNLRQEHSNINGRTTVAFAAILFCLALAPGCAESAAPVAAGSSLIQNGDFAKWSGGVPQGWLLEERVRSKGKIEQTKVGNAPVVKLSPNPTNTQSALPYAIGQAWPAAQFRGKRLHAKASIGAEDAAEASFGVFAVRANGQIDHSLLLQPDGDSGELTTKEADFVVPDSKDFVLIIARCAVMGTKGAAYFADVSLTVAKPGDKPSSTVGNKQAGDPLPASIRVDARKVKRAIPRTIYGTNIDWVHDAKGLWDPRRNRLDPTLVKLTKELGVSLIRFPGGALSDFYHWRDGIGPQSRRPTRHHTGPNSDQSKNTFGTDEALELAKLVGAELMITVNVGTGTPREAAEWVSYVRTRQKLNGTPPVTYWEVGNELYIKDDNPTTTVTDVAVTPEVYAQKFLEFAKAMREADPSIKVGGIGGQNYGRYTQNSYSDWNEKVLRLAGKEMDFFSIHNAYAPLVADHRTVTVRQVYAALLADPVLIKENLNTVSQQLERFVPGKGDQIEIAVTEWGPFFHSQPESPYVDHVKTLGSGLFVASTINAFLESPKTDVANFYKLVEPVFMGWIGKRGNEWIANAPYLAMQMYTHHFGDQLVDCRSKSPMYDTQAVGMVDRVSGVPYLDVVASTADGGKTLFIMAVNKHFDQPIKASIALEGFAAAKGTAWTLRGTGIDANRGAHPLRVPGIRWAKQATDALNPRFDKGAPDEVSIISDKLTAEGDSFEYTFLPHSVTSLEIQAGR